MTPTNEQSQVHSKLLKPLAQLQNGCISFAGLVAGQVGDPTADLHCTITVTDKRLFSLVAQDGVLGAAEAYLQGLWQADDLVCLVRILARNRALLDAINNTLWVRVSQMLMRSWHKRRRNNEQGSKRNIAEHYDLSNDFFALFLDPSLMYSSAVFTNSALATMSLEQESLEVASQRKLDLICQKLQLKPSDHVVEIGSGWGGFAIYAAQNYGCKVSTTTISAAQHLVAAQRIVDAGLAGQITLLQQDYRHLSGTYDKLVSIEMIEAVGHDYLDTYFAVCQRLLKPAGLGLIQAITIEDTRYQQALRTVDYIKRYVFPGSFIPCNTVMIHSAAAAGLKLMAFDDIGASYALTIKHWRTRFYKQADAVKQLGFDARFMRMWDFYLCYCEGGFMEGVISDVHLLFSNTMPANQQRSIL